jgi:hypothetical protein
MRSASRCRSPRPAPARPLAAQGLETSIRQRDRRRPRSRSRARAGPPGAEPRRLPRQTEATGHRHPPRRRGTPTAARDRHAGPRSRPRTSGTYKAGRPDRRRRRACSARAAEGLAQDHRGRAQEAGRAPTAISSAARPGARSWLGAALLARERCSTRSKGQQPVVLDRPSSRLRRGLPMPGNTFVLVYNLYDTEQLYERFPRAKARPTSSAASTPRTCARATSC